MLRKYFVLFQVQPFMQVDALRAIVIRLTGLPIGVFRLMNESSVEMHDVHTLDSYHVKVTEDEAMIGSLLIKTMLMLL